MYYNIHYNIYKQKQENYWYINAILYYKIPDRYLVEDKYKMRKKLSSTL